MCLLRGKGLAHGIPWSVQIAKRDATQLAAQAAAQEPASAAEGKGEEEAEAAGQQQGDEAQVKMRSLDQVFQQYMLFIPLAGCCCK